MLQAEKNELEELFAVPATLELLLAKVSFIEAIVRQLLASAAAHDPRLQAAKSMLDVWNSVMDDEEKQKRVVEHYQAILGAETAQQAENEPDGEELADELMSQVMANEEDLESTDNDDLEESVQATGKTQTRSAPTKGIPAKTSPGAPSKNGAQEKTAAKAKAKQADDGLIRRVPRKYWITLGVSSAALLLMTILSWSDNPDPDTLGNRALAAAKLEDRMEAFALLATFAGEPANLQMERLLRESKDREIVVRVIPMLASRKVAATTWELLIDTLNNSDAAVRSVAWDTLNRSVPLSAAEKASFKADDPAGTRESAVMALKEKYTTTPKFVTQGPPM